MYPYNCRTCYQAVRGDIDVDHSRTCTVQGLTKLPDLRMRAHSCGNMLTLRTCQQSCPPCHLQGPASALISAKGVWQRVCTTHVSVCPRTRLYSVLVSVGSRPKNVFLSTPPFLHPCHTLPPAPALRDSHSMSRSGRLALLRHSRIWICV